MLSFYSTLYVVSFSFSFLLWFRSFCYIFFNNFYSIILVIFFSVFLCYVNQFCCHFCEYFFVIFSFCSKLFIFFFVIILFSFLLASLQSPPPPPQNAFSSQLIFQDISNYSGRSSGITEVKDRGNGHIAGWRSGQNYRENRAVSSSLGQSRSVLSTLTLPSIFISPFLCIAVFFYSSIPAVDVVCLPTARFKSPLKYSNQISEVFSINTINLELN
jgi:predicted PurR-regulated permease PerM